MAAIDQNTGALFEGLVSGEADAVKLVTAFSDTKTQIVSPTVSGLLSGFQFGRSIIGGCVDFESDEVELSDGTKNDRTAVINNNSDYKESESSKEPEFITSLASFVEKVKEVRSSFLPFELYDGTTITSSSFNNISEMESYENAFMRMLGMPDDKDVARGTGSNGAESFDTSKKIIYATPRYTDGAIVKNVTTIAEITGDSPITNDRFADIIAERQRLPSSSSGGGRYFDFGRVSVTTLQDEKQQELAEKKILEAGGDTTISSESIALNYYKPDHLFRFYYLKSVPIQSSKIYGCVSEPQKIVLKPFDTNSSSKINGIKPKTSLLETIIRLRLDRITGSPNIYSTTSNEKDPNGTIPTTTVKPENLGEDSLTQVECFLLQKLEKVLYGLAKKYTEDTKSIAEKEVKENSEKGVLSQEKTDAEKKADDEKKELYKSELSNLEILKAREDAILFLLKDTSSSSDNKNYSTAYSSLDLQEGIIRTSSGFSDALSGPLYSILSQRSQYLGNKIRELSHQLDSIDPASSGTADADSVKPNPNSEDRSSYSYIGVCSEDFIVYTMALLSLNQDYLIGLLPQTNRINMANLISGSVLNSKKDPYGIIARVNKSPKDGGFPSVSDSVNALSVLVCNFYSIYISSIKKRMDTLVVQLADLKATTQSNSAKIE
jgi:hypothetical protein